MRVCLKFDVDFITSVKIMVCLRRVDFIVFVTYEWKPRRCNSCNAFGHSRGKCPGMVVKPVHTEEVVKGEPSKGDDLAIVACGDVVLESFKQVKEGEFTGSPNKPLTQIEKDAGDSVDFTLVTSHRRRLVLVRDHGGGS